MDKLYFITSNKGKFEDAKIILPNIEQIDIDLPELQEFDARKIIEEKLKVAIKKFPSRRFFCEDTSLYFQCLNGLPGPLIKWFLEKLGTIGLVKLVENYRNNNAAAKTLVGYTDGKKIIFFEGVSLGKIVKPRGSKGFGWASIFQPENQKRTFGEMDLREKSQYSMRKKALIKLKTYIEQDGE